VQNIGALKIQDWKMADQTVDDGATENAGVENAARA